MRRPPESRNHKAAVQAELPMLQWSLSWEFEQILNGYHIGSCFYPMTDGNMATGCWKCTQFPTLHFSTHVHADQGIMYRP